MMNDMFKIRDAQLLEDLFITFEKEGKTFVLIDDLIGRMVFFFRAKFDVKLAIYFEVHMLSEVETVIPKEKLISLVKECWDLYNDVSESAKKIADHMNESRDGKIKFKEFKSFC